MNHPNTRTTRASRERQGKQPPQDQQTISPVIYCVFRGAAPRWQKFHDTRKNIAKISPYPVFEFQFLWALRAQLLEYKCV
jgi:hypothetical protein